MTVLLVITSLLLVVSGAVKVRSGLRIGIGVHLTTLVELLFALLTGFAGLSGLGAAPATAWMVPVGVLLVLGSSTLYGLRMRAFRRARAEREAARLETYVKYFHQLDEDASG